MGMQERMALVNRKQPDLEMVEPDVEKRSGLWDPDLDIDLDSEPDFDTDERPRYRS